MLLPLLASSVIGFQSAAFTLYVIWQLWKIGDSFHVLGLNIKAKQRFISSKTSTLAIALEVFYTLPLITCFTANLRFAWACFLAHQLIATSGLARLEVSMMTWAYFWWLSVASQPLDPNLVVTEQTTISAHCGRHLYRLRWNPMMPSMVFT